MAGHRTTVLTAEGTMAVVDEGRGPTVVFSHGTPSSSFEFRGVIEALAQTHRCVAVDHLGFGRSDKPVEADYSVVAHQRRFAVAMDQLEVDDAVFVLHDFGASFAIDWMLSHPERVRGVVLANTFLWPATGPMRWVLSFYATALGRWIYRAFNVSARWLLPWAWGRHRPLDAQTHGRYLAPFADRTSRYATSALPAELVGDTLTHLASRAGELAQWPVRLVWGLADPAVGPDALARWRSLLPDAEAETLADAGHFVADEAPEAVARAVRSLGGPPRDGWVPRSPRPRRA